MPKDNIMLIATLVDMGIIKLGQVNLEAIRSLVVQLVALSLMGAVNVGQLALTVQGA